MPTDTPLSRPEAILSIAGSDSGGGAGMQADLRTIAAHGFLGCSAITAVTVQNTLGVTQVEMMNPQLVMAQMRAVLDDLPIKAAKTGMLGTAEIIEAVAASWSEHARHIPLVVDPVIFPKAGERLLENEALQCLIERLLPLATVFTPNLPEAATLLNRERIENPERAADSLAALCGPQTVVLLKGGHLHDSPQARDLVRLPDGSFFWLESPRIDTDCDHGTGCTLSAAIACELGAGLPMTTALKAAKRYVTGALKQAEKVGEGHSPVNHLWALRRGKPTEGVDS